MKKVIPTILMSACACFLTNVMVFTFPSIFVANMWQIASGGISFRKGKGPTEWEGAPEAICHIFILIRNYFS